MLQVGQTVNIRGIPYEVEEIDANGIAWLLRRGKRGGAVAGRWICRADGSGFRKCL